MPKRSKANADAEAAEPKRRSERLVNKPAIAKAEPKPKKEKAAPKPKKAKEVKKAEPEEKEVPSENGEAKAEEEVRG
ncbi:non-histone chromosomal protein HMG-14 isoform X2 [Coregonus clupeaformis]|uniref:non-histone chromosomal protein HMG-14 isoform X2 n=1 Tax=Coregonus clupeaformis TaxID=59861 RepID=UPI001BDFA4AE|nr:non-histone chromosomal protein HMG-14 isoform X2 [Coregonus clupeaformis]